MTKTNFSIIICCFNEEKNIKELFNSLNKIDFSYNSFEIIMVDDGSTDKTLDNIKFFFKLINFNINIKVYSINHSGLSIARNTGYNLSNFNYCLFCDADAVIDPNILKAYEKEIITKEDFVYAGRVENLNDLDPVSNFIYNLHNKPSLALTENKLIGANMMINKNLINNELPFFDDFIARGDEWAMFINLSKKYNITSSSYVYAAIVKNETSSTLSEWFRVMFIEGYNNKIIENFFAKSFSKYLLYSLIKINTLLLFFSIFFLILNINLFFFISISIFIFRLIPRLKYIKRGMRNTIKLSFILSFLSFFISIFGIMLSDIGYSVSFLKNKKMKNKKTIATKIHKISLL